VTKESDALDLEGGVFSLKDPKRIAASLKRSAERSHRRKAEPYRSALSMLVFYMNRAGKKLPASRPLAGAGEERIAPAVRAVARGPGAGKHSAKIFQQGPGRSENRERNRFRPGAIDFGLNRDDARNVTSARFLTRLVGLGCPLRHNRGRALRQFAFALAQPLLGFLTPLRRLAMADVIRFVGQHDLRHGEHPFSLHGDKHGGN
jgi:hypothetical protein